ncbi:MAG: PilZ domain-containing protein [Candidatus Omnitrophica bacterium]|nr:PilZ domain-containing protein [Candidatus Omnitrophota bacterium]
MTAEARKFERAPIPLDAQYRRLSEIGPWQPTRVIDVSAMGMRCQVQEQVEVEETIQLKLQLPTTQESLEVSGVVRRQQTEGGAMTIGVEFIDLTPGQQAAIDAMVQFLGKRYPPTSFTP